VSTEIKFPIFGPEGYAELDGLLQELSPSKTFLLVDSNTAQCLNHFVPKLANLAADFEILEVDPGEESKDLEVAAGLWQTLLEYGADRHSLLINIGGGVVCDLGGFISSTFKRGIPFINVPTSLLAMVDASVGGKTGVNFAGVKNQIGTFAAPELVLIDLEFLSTLPAREWSSGHAEMVKHALISGKNWPGIIHENRSTLSLEKIRESIQIKYDVVSQDYLESGLRKVLNFGHTFGHAYESLMHEQGRSITHGEAVLQGLHVALELSNQQDLLEELRARYTWTIVPEEWFDSLWALQELDKKNRVGSVQFVLLKELGTVNFDQRVIKDEWVQVLNRLNTHREQCPRY
jgi:3-dehydroquinate synthase